MQGLSSEASMYVDERSMLSLAPAPFRQAKRTIDIAYALLRSSRGFSMHAAIGRSNRSRESEAFASAFG